MPSTCMLHNTTTCAKRRTIEKAKTDNTIRIVHGYDWGTHSDNAALIYDEVMSVVRELNQEFKTKITFNSLGGKDGSIYCDICRQIRSADVALFDLSTNNLNVTLELGMAIGTGAFVFILRSKHYQRAPRALSDLNGILEYRFSRRSGRINFEADFRRSLKMKLKKIITGKINTPTAQALE